LIREMHSHASSTYPEECCGLLVGRFEQGSSLKIVTNCKRMNNVFEKKERHHRYTINPREFMNVENEAESNGEEIVGVYHSHPNAPARPSEFDKTYAWPSFTYLVIEVRGSRPMETRSWLLREDRSGFVEEELVTVE
jgi:proteasome lid subunit RPN8/RPN11